MAENTVIEFPNIAKDHYPRSTSSRVPLPTQDQLNEALDVASQLLSGWDGSGITYRLIMALDRFMQSEWKRRRRDFITRNHVPPAIKAAVANLERELAKGGAQ
jgi:hypothetical protein